MRSFEDWVKEVEKEIKEENLFKRDKEALLIKLQTLKTNRTLLYLNYFMRWLHSYGLQYLCPTPKEIDCWIIQGILRKV